MAGVALLTLEGTRVNFGRTDGVAGAVALFPSIDTTGTITSMSAWVHKPTKRNTATLMGAVNSGRRLFESAVQAAKHGSGILGIRVVVQRAGGPDAPEDDYSWGAVLPNIADGAQADVLDAPLLPPGVEAKDLKEVRLNVGNGKLAAISMVTGTDGKYAAMVTVG